ncbi:unnamed protein product [marine sediment metagenome]|uniref:RiboL-PSP-HEPN domain-containing protein n=1 Tax=marine sediment metagenome TaxID=412755 RepID=X0U8G5_9ZZZZ
MTAENLQATTDRLSKELLDYAIWDVDQQKDERSKVLILHLHIERVLDVFIDSWFERPKPLLGFNFMKKLKIVNAVCALSEKLYNNVRQINLFRNQFAHTLNREEIKLNFSKLVIERDISNLNDSNKIKVAVFETLVKLNEELYGTIREREDVLKDD